MDEGGNYVVTPLVLILILIILYQNIFHQLTSWEIKMTLHTTNQVELENQPLINRIIREPECREMTGLTRQYRLELEKRGRFPKRIKLAERIHGWRLSEIQQWIDQVANDGFVDWEGK